MPVAHRCLPFASDSILPHVLVVLVFCKSPIGVEFPLPCSVRPPYLLIALLSLTLFSLEWNPITQSGVVWAVLLLLFHADIGIIMSLHQLGNLFLLVVGSDAFSLSLTNKVQRQEYLLQ